MNKTVTIIDYGLGNLFSVSQAFEKCGANVKISNDASHILGADYLVLPGVGAFGDGIKSLREKKFDEAILKYVETQRPFLGICLGMQMLFSSGHEFGIHKGLNIIPGKTELIPKAKLADGRDHKIPHIGWNTIRPPTNAAWQNTALKNLNSQVSVYFVHSYRGIPERDEQKLALCDYNGVEICAAVRSNNVLGLQFHPEKSGEIGLKILSAFLD